MQGFVIFWLIVLAITFTVYSYPFTGILYLLAGIYLFSRLWVQHTSNRLQPRRQFDDRVFHGDEVEVRLTLDNSGWLPIPWVSLSETLPPQLRAPATYRQVDGFAARESKRYTYTLNCRRRGYYHIGPLDMEIGDLLGTQPTRKKQLEPDYLIVYPPMVPLQKLGLPTHSPLAVLPARSPLFEDPTYVTGVRDYQHGDSPRRIHWTASASAGQLLVKQYKPAIARDTLICLDLRPGDYEGHRLFAATELAIVTAASLANHVITNEGLSVGLVTEAWDMLQGKWSRISVPPRSERAHLMSMLDALARVQVSPTIMRDPLAPVESDPSTTPFAEMLRQESINLNWGVTLAIITGSENLELMDTLVHLRRTGFAVALIVIRSERLSAETRRRCDLLGISIYQVRDVGDLEVQLADVAS